MMKEVPMTDLTRIFQACAVSMTLLLAACIGDHPAVTGPVDALSPAQRFPIALEARMQAFRLSYDNASNDLDAVSQAELERIARDYLENGSGAIAVSASPNERNAPQRVTERLVALGVQRNRILIGTGDGTDAGGQVRVSYIRYSVHAEECGNWSEDLGVTYANTPSPNFGCATQHNVAAMIADPRDLATPKPVEATDADRRLTVLDKYRKGEITAATKAGEQSGVVSGVATGGK
jgi:pilus assembly protein CpaD